MKKKGNKRQYNIFLIVGIVIVLTAIFIAVFCPIITKYDPLLVNVEERITAPTGQHKLGTDEMGRDVLSRMFFGVRASMIIGVSVAIISTMAGIIVGVIAGYYNKVDNVLMRILDGVMAFPSIIIAIALAGILGTGKINIIIALSVAYFPTMARIVRSSVLSLRDIEYVQSIKVLGASDVFHLREGVLFHDGTEMKAEDVKASFDRWFSVNEMGISVSEYLNSVDVIDDYTVSVKLNSVYAPFLNVIASPTSNQKMVVRPASLIEKYGNNVLEEHIGTGPYKFDSWVPDASVKLVKFDDYVPVEEEASGLAGKRVAYANEIDIQFVTDESVRVSGVETGEFMFAEEIAQDKYSQLESSENTIPQILDADVEGMLTFNCGAAPFNDINARKAVAIGLDLEELGTAQIGDEKFWKLDGCLFDKSTVWYDENAGKDIYAKNDLDLAKEYLEKSNYNGEPIVIVQGKDDTVESQGAEDLKSQLEKIGFNVEVELYDRATVMEKRSQKEGWAIHLTYFSVWNADPQVWSAWVGTNGWITNWDDEDSKKMDDIFARMLVELDEDARYEIVQEWYDAFWEYVPYVKTIDYSRMNATNAKLQGYANYCQPFFWNTWVEE